MTARTKRVPEIEWMKAAAAIIIMIFTHVYELLPIKIDSATEEIFARLIEFMSGTPGAPAFMFAMGWGAAYSVRSTSKTYINRFFQLALLGVVVNFFAQYVPMLLDPENVGALEANAHMILATDIYFFAALASLYLALMKKLNGKSAICASVVIASACIAIRLIFGFENYATFGATCCLACLFAKTNFHTSRSRSG